MLNFSALTLKGSAITLILSLPSLGERAGIRIVRYDFSEPQAGKDVCDRRIATVKSHMRRYINEPINLTKLPES